MIQNVSRNIRVYPYSKSFDTEDKSITKSRKWKKCCEGIIEEMVGII